MREVVARDDENKNEMCRLLIHTRESYTTYWYHARARRSHLYTTRIVDYVLVLRARASFQSS